MPKLFFFWHDTSSGTCLNISIFCAKYQKASVISSALVQDDFPLYALSKHKQNLCQSLVSNFFMIRLFQQTLWYKLINVNLVAINVFAKFDEIPPLGCVCVWGGGGGGEGGYNKT